MESSLPSKKTGLARILSACSYSLAGLKDAISNETAFKQEAIFAFILLISLFFLPLSLVWKALLLSSTLFILIVELLNSAIEAVVDIASPEIHPLAKKSKDFASAAVFMSITITISLWSMALSTLF